MDDYQLEVSGDVLYRPVMDRGGILLDLKQRRYFALNDVAARAWEVLAATGSVDRTIETLLREFEVDRETLAHDVAEIGEEFVAAGWLERGEPRINHPPSR